MSRKEVNDMKYLTKQQIKAIRVVLGMNGDLRHKYTYNPSLVYNHISSLLDLCYCDLGGVTENERYDTVREWIFQILRGIER